MKSDQEILESLFKRQQKLYKRAINIEKLNAQIRYFQNKIREAKN